MNALCALRRSGGCGFDHRVLGVTRGRRRPSQVRGRASPLVRGGRNARFAGIGPACTVSSAMPVIRGLRGGGVTKTCDLRLAGPSFTAGVPRENVYSQIRRLLQAAARPRCRRPARQAHFESFLVASAALAARLRPARCARGARQRRTRSCTTTLIFQGATSRWQSSARAAGPTRTPTRCWARPATAPPRAASSFAARASSSRTTASTFSGRCNELRQRQRLQQEQQRQRQQ